jgi:hypothetical protein
MKYSKPISMKKLHQWAEEYAHDKNWPEKPVEKYKEDLMFLTDFFRYVWEHRND